MVFRIENIAFGVDGLAWAYSAAADRALVCFKCWSECTLEVKYTGAREHGSKIVVVAVALVVVVVAVVVVVVVVVVDVFVP